MKFLFTKVIALYFVCMMTTSAQSLKGKLEGTYFNWRNAVIRKDVVAWKKVTAYHRKISIYNRIVSAHLPYPQSIFKLPVAPPSIDGLKAVNINSKGGTAIATYFGKIDFGVGGEPTENLMVLYFVKEADTWKYDTADFINLMAIPEVRAEMLSGNYSYVKQGDFMASGKLPPLPKLLEKRGYLSKVYAFCPGREVKVDFNNGVSKHRFQNDKAAEIIIGGALDGKNMIKFTTKSLPGSTGNEPLDIRVFLMPKLEGAKPLKVYQYRVTPEEIKAGKKPAKSMSSTVFVTAGQVKSLITK